MHDLTFHVYAMPENPILPEADDLPDELPGKPCDLPYVDPAWLHSYKPLDLVLHPSEVHQRLFDHLEVGEPLTVCELAHKLSISLRRAEEGVSAACEYHMPYRRFKRWIDLSPFGQGREFVGTVGSLGIAEPSGLAVNGDELPAIDPRTVLACIRSARVVQLRHLASRLLVPESTLAAVVAELVEAGHAFTRKRGKPIWLYPIIWPAQNPKRKPRKLSWEKWKRTKPEDRPKY